MDASGSPAQAPYDVVRAERSGAGGDEEAVVGIALGRVEGWLDGNPFLIQELDVHLFRRNIRRYEAHRTAW